MTFVRQNTRPFINIGGPAYYVAPNPMVNLMPRSNSSWSTGFYPTGPSYIHQDGWLYGVPNTTSLLLTIFGPDPTNLQWTKVKPGTYVVLFPSQWTVTVSSVTGISNRTLVSPGRYEFDSVESPNSIILSVINNSGSAQDFTHCQIYLKAYESLIQADPYAFDPDWIAQFAHMEGVRVMDLFECNNFGWDGSGNITLTSVQPSDYHQVTDRYYTPSNYTGNGWPIEICTKIAVTLKCALWITFPCKFDLTQFTAFANIVKANDPDGVIPAFYIEYGNENWNFTFKGTAWLRDVGSVGINVVDKDGNPSSNFADKIGCAASNGALKMWAAFESVFGASRIVKCYGGVPTSPLFFAGGFMFVDTVTGKRMKDFVQQYDVNGYINMTVGGIVTNISQKSMVINKVYNQGNIWALTSLENFLPALVAQYAAVQAQLLDVFAPNCRLTMYEGGQALANIGTNIAGQNFQASVDAAGNNLVFTEDISQAFDAGDEFYCGSAVLPAGAPFARVAYAGSISGTNLKLYPTQADAIAGTNVITLNGPAPLWCGVAAPGTNTGNGTVSQPAILTNVVEKWTLTAKSSTTFGVVGAVSGAQTDATVGTPYNNGLTSFTISAGGTAFVSGDTFTYTASTYACDNLGRLITLNQYFKDFLNSEDGKTIYVDWWLAMRGLIAVICQFVESGGWSSATTQGFDWGMLASQYDDTNPRWDFYQALTYKSLTCDDC